jgi:hypothetical protein
MLLACGTVCACKRKRALPGKRITPWRSNDPTAGRLAYATIRRNALALIAPYEFWMAIDTLVSVTIR